MRLRKLAADQSKDGLHKGCAVLERIQPLLCVTCGTQQSSGRHQANGIRFYSVKIEGGTTRLSFGVYSIEAVWNSGRGPRLKRLVTKQLHVLYHGGSEN